MIGCFENYLSAKSTSDDWAKITEVHDWLFLYDRLDGRLKADRDYELLPYVPYTFVPWYKLFSSHTARPIEFPKADYEVSFTPSFCSCLTIDKFVTIRLTSNERRIKKSRRHSL